MTVVSFAVVFDSFTTVFTVACATGAFWLCSLVGTTVVATVFTGVVVGASVVFAGAEDLSELVHPQNSVAASSNPRIAIMYTDLALCFIRKIPAS